MLKVCWWKKKKQLRDTQSSHPQHRVEIWSRVTNTSPLLHPCHIFCIVLVQKVFLLITTGWKAWEAEMHLFCLYHHEPLCLWASNTQPGIHPDAWICCGQTSIITKPHENNYTSERNSGIINVTRNGNIGARAMAVGHSRCWPRMNCRL